MPVEDDESVSGKNRMRNAHLLAANLTRTARGHSVWSIYPNEGKASVGPRRSGARILIHYTLKPGEVRCPACAQVMELKADT